MAERRPTVLINGIPTGLPSGDVIPVSAGGTGGTDLATALAGIGAAPVVHTHVAADIGSGAATAGQVATADGSGGVGWVTLPAPVMTFLGLTDTPAAYTAEKFLKVNAAGDAVELADAPTTSTTFLDLSDTPAAYTASYWLRVNAAGDAIELVEMPAPDLSSHLGTYDHSKIATALQPGSELNVLSSGLAPNGNVPVANGSGGISWSTTPAPSMTFTQLTDTPAAYVAGKLVKVNPTGDGLIFGDPSGTTVAWGDITGDITNQTDLTPSAIGASPTSHNHNGVYELDGTVAAHEVTYDHTLIATAVQINAPISSLSSGAASNGQVATADGAGGIGWTAGGGASGAVIPNVVTVGAVFTDNSAVLIDTLTVLDTLTVDGYLGVI